MSTTPKSLKTGLKRLTNRRRTKRRTPKRTQVLPSIQDGDLDSVMGCPTIDTNLLEQPQQMVVTRQEKDIITSAMRERVKDLPALQIDSISYSFYSHEELEKEAVFEVTETGDEGIFTVNDPRSGVVDYDKICRTCSQDNMTCPGHLGILKLNEHIIHPLFKRAVVDVLSSVCNSCGGLILSEDQLIENGVINLTGSKRLRKIAELSKKLPCRQSVQLEDMIPESIAAEVGSTAEIKKCKPNPIYKTARLKDTKNIFYTYDEKKGDDNIRTIDEIEAIFESISERDAKLMGFETNSHPSRFILRSIPIIPICARPPVMQEGVLNADHITTMYMSIVRINKELDPSREIFKTEKGQLARENLVSKLIFQIGHLMDNTDKKFRQGNKTVYLSLKERIQGKEAIIRSLLMGKRVNYSARTVLSPDPNLKFGQIRVPKAMAPYLTMHEVVSPSNIGKLTRLFRAGKITHITPIGGRMAGKTARVTEKVRENETLMFGDEVDRWLENGDYVVFNRQPTLHKQSFMGYEVVLGDPKTIGLHMSYTAPHNAD